jgi:hypothetical protein
MTDKKPYKTTDRAGWYVAGHRIPQRADGDGLIVPTIGHLLQLTDAEAKYPLLNGEIEPAETAVPSPAAARRSAANA